MYSPHSPMDQFLYGINYLLKPQPEKKKEHLLLSCGAGEVPGCMVVSEAGRRAFVSSCCHFLTEGRYSSRPLGPQLFFSLNSQQVKSVTPRSPVDSLEQTLFRHINFHIKACIWLTLPLWQKKNYLNGQCHRYKVLTAKNVHCKILLSSL